MNHRASDGETIRIDRTIPLWGIISVCGSICAAAVAGYVQIDRLNQQTASLASQVAKLYERIEVRSTSDFEAKLKLVQIELEQSRINGELAKVQSRVLTIETKGVK